MGSNIFRYKIIIPNTQLAFNISSTWQLSEGSSHINSIIWANRSWQNTFIKTYKIISINLKATATHSPILSVNQIKHECAVQARLVLRVFTWGGPWQGPRKHKEAKKGNSMVGHHVKYSTYFIHIADTDHVMFVFQGKTSIGWEIPPNMSDSFKWGPPLHLLYSECFHSFVSISYLPVLHCLN